MAVLPFVVLFAVFGASVLAEPSLTFPEVARGTRNSRIVSGWEAMPGQLPFQLSLRMVSPIGGVTACGASIIHSEWGLTAAHCTATRVSVVIRAGAVSLTQPVYIFETTEYYNHPLYIEELQSVVQPNDIGVIKFGRSLVFNDYVKPIRIQSSESRNRNYQGIRLTASGWGRTWTAPEGGAPENLNWVYLSGTSNAFCWAAFGGSNIIQDSTICASGYNVTSQSTCQGDSGGPLTVVEDDGELSEVGVASFVSGTGCHTDFPAGFIRPGHYHDWFTSVTGIDFDWDLQPETTPSPTESTTTTEDNTTTSTDATTPSETDTTTSEVATTPSETDTTTSEVATTPSETDTTTSEDATTPSETDTTNSEDNTTTSTVLPRL
ncbi:collagenase-like [Aphomia sociella]